MKPEEPYWMTSNGEKGRGREAVVLALMEMFSDENMPDAFRVNGQTWQERAEAWVMHAIDQLERELEEYSEIEREVEFRAGDRSTGSPVSRYGGLPHEGRQVV